MIAGFAFISGKKLSASAIASRAGLTAALVVSGGVAFAFGEIGYLHTDGTVRKAQSDGTVAEAAAEVICVQATGVASGSSGTFRVSPGIITFPSAVGTAQALVYVSATAGGLTTTPPAIGSGLYSKVVGRWLSTTKLHWFSSPEVVPFGPM